MIRRSQSYLVLLSLLTLCAAHAAGQDRSADVKAALKTRYPDVAIESVNPAGWEGWYEVVTGSELTYTNADATLLFAGKVYDTKTNEDLTERRWNELQSVDFESLPFDMAIESVKGNGRRRIAVFADPLCPFCRRLETALESVTDVTVYTFLYPIESIHPGATEMARRIWCSENRATAWSEWMLRQSPPPAASCAGDPTSALLSVGEKLRIDGTPTMVFSNGHRVAGALSAEEIERGLDAALR